MADPRDPLKRALVCNTFHQLLAESLETLLRCGRHDES